MRFFHARPLRRIIALLGGIAATAFQPSDPPSAADQLNAKAVNVAVALAHDVRDSLKNPPSFELVQADITADGSVCMTYRATNGFGGTVTARAVRPRLGKDYWTSDGGGADFVREWAKSCGDGRDETATVKHFM